MDPQTDVPSPASLLCAGALPIIHCTLACRPWLRPAALLGYTLLSGVAGIGLWSVAPSPAQGWLLLSQWGRGVCGPRLL